jgi:hypothetical protein
MFLATKPMKAPIAQSGSVHAPVCSPVQATHRTAQSALSSDGMEKKTFKITRIAALVSFNGSRELQLGYDIEDCASENNCACLTIKDTKGLYILVRRSYKSPIEKSGSPLTGRVHAKSHPFKK